LEVASPTFLSSLSSSLSSLLSSSHLCDCTILCKDGQVVAHKLVLAAGSSLLRTVLSSPAECMILARSSTTKQVQSLLSYLYKGAAQVEEDQLASFLQLAEDLQVEGLVRTKEAPVSNKEENKNKAAKNVQEVVTVTVTNITDTQEGKDTHEKIDKSKNRFTRNNAKGKVRNDQQELANIRMDIGDERFEFQDSSRSTPNQIEKLSDKRLAEHLPNNETKQEPSMPIVDRMDDVNGNDVQWINPEVNSNEEQKEVNNDVAGTAAKEEKIVDAVMDSFQQRQNLAVYCDVCDTEDRMHSSLQEHMKARREVQCSDCKLHFSNCNTLKVHKDGRCRAIKKLSS